MKVVTIVAFLWEFSQSRGKKFLCWIKNQRKKESNMNERNKKATVIMVYWCLLFAVFGIQICNGHSNTIKDYNKDYAVSATNSINQYDKNDEIRGEWKSIFGGRSCGSWKGWEWIWRVLHLCYCYHQ
jgi:hypothetical protein